MQHFSEMPLYEASGMKALWTLLLAFGIGHAETLTGYVVAISDGDTVTVLDDKNQQHKIRLASIDAPEKAQAFGERSKQNLAGLVFNKNVTVEWTKLDRYGRTVGKISVNGKDANLEQIRAGMAWWYEKYRKEQSLADQEIYQVAERQARMQRIGLWRDASPIAPWDWRHGEAVVQNQDCSCASGATCVGPKDRVPGRGVRSDQEVMVSGLAGA